MTRRNVILRIENVSKRFESLRAVDDVSLAVPEGHIVGLIGPNGSGKSTLLNVTSGVLRADAGRIIFDGQDIVHRSADEIFQLGLARSFQDPSLFFRMTVLDNILLPIKEQDGEDPIRAPLHRTWEKQEARFATVAAGALQRLDLDTHFDSLASDLSGGQMKLLELGRSLTSAPKMLLLDEPTAGIAPNLARNIFEQIEHLRRTRGLTFLIVEHRLGLLFDFVDQVYVMHLGRLIAHGPPADIAANAKVREIYFGE
ncbi:MAG: Lipopolysaccharide export system ATP-binding protein LptB [Anaerolineales bacterium]|nr:Lipopolysaccharide export system ATP-binding protein LptB [Anaerolineales bacterium]